MLCPKDLKMVAAGFSLREKFVGANHDLPKEYKNVGAQQAEPKNSKTVGAALAAARLGHGVPCPYN